VRETGEEQKILDIISMSKREYAEYVTLKNSHNRLIKGWQVKNQPLYIMEKK